MLVDAHTGSVAALGDVARRGIYDNMRTAVDKIHKGKGRTVNARFSVMCAHYLYGPDFCNVASPRQRTTPCSSADRARHDAPGDGVRCVGHHSPGKRVRDYRLARPAHAPLPHRGEGQRKPSLPAQQRYGKEANQGQVAGPQGQRQSRSVGRCRFKATRIHHPIKRATNKARFTFIHSQPPHGRLPPLAHY